MHTCMKMWRLAQDLLQVVLQSVLLPGAGINTQALLVATFPTELLIAFIDHMVCLFVFNFAVGPV